MRSEDDLTYKLGAVIKGSTNVRKSEQEGTPAYIVTEYEQLLQVCVIEYAFSQSLFLNIF
jgi:DNA-directed RNA polymerase II subunit RPB1